MNLVAWATPPASFPGARVAPARCYLGKCRPFGPAHRRSPRRVQPPRAALVAGDLPLWATLLVVSSLGLSAEKTKVGAALSAPLVTMALAIAMSNCNIIPIASPVYVFIADYLVRLAVPLLLFDADLKKLIRRTGPMAFAFLLGTLATVVGSTVAWMLVPLGLGPDSWKIAAMLTGRHIGGAVNYVAIADSTAVSGAIMVAGLAADNLVVALYFVLLFYMAPREPTDQDSELSEQRTDDSDQFALDEMAKALTVSVVVCALGTWAAKFAPAALGSIPIITVLSVAIATGFPRILRRMRPAATALGILFMQLFFAASGAAGSLQLVIRSAPTLLIFSTVQILVHLITLLGLGRAFGVSRKLLLLSSNSNVGGPTTAAGMAASKGWQSLVVPALLSGILGYSIGTFVSLGLAHLVFRNPRFTPLLLRR